MSNFSNLSVKQLNEKPIDDFFTDKKFKGGFIMNKPVKWKTPKMIKDLTNVMLFGN